MKFKEEEEDDPQQLQTLGKLLGRRTFNGPSNTAADNPTPVQQLLRMAACSGDKPDSSGQDIIEEEDREWMLDDEAGVLPPSAQLSPAKSLEPVANAASTQLCSSPPKSLDELLQSLGDATAVQVAGRPAKPPKAQNPRGSRSRRQLGVPVSTDTTPQQRGEGESVVDRPLKRKRPGKLDTLLDSISAEFAGCAAMLENNDTFES